MSKSTNLNFTQNIDNAFAAFTNADAAATLKTVLTAGVNDEIVKAIQISSSDSAARVIDVLINDGTSDRLLVSVNVPANSGTNGTTAAVDALAASMNPGLPLDSMNKRVLPLKAGMILKVRNQTQLTASTTLTVTVLGELY